MIVIYLIEEMHHILQKAASSVANKKKYQLSEISGPYGQSDPQKDAPKWGQFTP